MLLLQLALLLALVALCWLQAFQAESAYQSSGWRPPGQSFNPCHIPATKKTKQRESTTPRSRQPTTTMSSDDLGDDDDDLSKELNGNEQSPALAVANSYAFNRPIYVYNAYPYRPSSFYLLRG